MKERQILFSGPMVRALLRDENPKTHTRRMVNPQPEHPGFASPSRRMLATDDEGDELYLHSATLGCAIRCPYGPVGDRLWGRETFFAYGRWETRFSAKKGRDEWHFIDMTLECGRAYQYAADAPDVPLADNRGGVLPGWWRRPAIFMPRAASRITLEVTGVRIERLQDISEADAVAEGTFPGEYEFDNGEGTETAIESYRCLWNSINGAESWGANPWIWVVEFKRIKP